MLKFVACEKSKYAQVSGILNIRVRKIKKLVVCGLSKFAAGKVSKFTVKLKYR